ncbi:hypothetical protein ML462_13960 [Gramella lutea]|uniref:Uncharacterized protein n=1 Tax=Christiangramia lutea TaxID=1607951 RepID=A0A9X2ABI4_9FLAO|nr:hypothetical protein [Christiangramia lutea]MCH4824276.1 hypothetical protein [Christiangramia lutea]
MKIELKLSTDTLMAANKILKEVYNLPVSCVSRENVYKSIGMDLADKFDSKCKAQIRKANLFENKKVKLTLKYHEAWALEALIADLTDQLIENNEYQRSLLFTLRSTIHQKLA